MPATPNPPDAPARQAADDPALRHVRPAVRDLLESTPAFARLTPDEQRQLAHEMVRVCNYLVNPNGLTAQAFDDSNTPPVASAQAEQSANDQLRGRLAGRQGFAGQDFQAGAVRAGVEQFGELVKKVDFPKFVAGLIQNVFQAIVDSSIQQMRAYAELVANVAKSVDEFARDNISENNARDWLVDKYPDKLGLETPGMSGGFAEGDTPPAATPKITVTSDNVQQVLTDISQELRLAKPITDLSNEEEEVRLVTAARTEIARGRQQLLASMVMLGINRIVVTDGLIHAKVVFDMRASDLARRRASASMYDKAEEKASTKYETGYGAWFSPVSASFSAGASTEHMATVESSVDESSESKAEVKAKLTGEVRVNFKSDYLPMERMASPATIAAIQGRAVPPDKPVSGT